MRKRKLSKAEREQRAYQRENESRWRKAWLAEHPSHTSVEYTRLRDANAHEVWDWRRAKGREAIEAERQAWVVDHPESDPTFYDFYDYVTSCAVSGSPTGEADYAEFSKWQEARYGAAV